MLDQKNDHKWWHPIEEGIITFILALMTILISANIFFRIVPGGRESILWTTEGVSYLFAWLVILGLGYLVRTQSNLGVDVVINLLSLPTRRIFGLIAAACCIVYALLMLIGAYNYSAHLYNLPELQMSETHTWLPIGIEQEMKPYDYRGYTPVFDIPMPNWLRPIWEPIFLGEQDPPYNKLPINIPTLALFLGVFWMLCRLVIAFFQIWRGVNDRLISSHEVEDAIANASEENV